MAADFGDGTWRSRPLPLLSMAAVLAVVMGSAVVIGVWLIQRPENIARARQWSMSGPPCPALSAKAFSALPIRPTSDFDYYDVSFARAFGHVYCDEIHDNGGGGFGAHPVCQFTSPDALEVTSTRGSFYFFPSTGPATVAVEGGVPSCVRGGWYRGSQNQW